MDHDAVKAFFLQLWAAVRALSFAEVVRDPCGEFMKLVETYVTSKIPALAKLPRSGGARSGVNAAIALVMVGGAWQLLSSAGVALALGVVYPAYQSMAALRSRDSTDDDRQWLTYWCVFGAFSVADTFFAPVLRLLPLYGLAKLVFFLWLMHPSLRGAEALHRAYLEPWMERGGWFARADNTHPSEEEAENGAGGKGGGDENDNGHDNGGDDDGDDEDDDVLVHHEDAPPTPASQ